jgi:hypothetical protein
MLSKGIQGAARFHPPDSLNHQQKEEHHIQAFQAVLTAQCETLKAYGLHLPPFLSFPFLSLLMVARTFWTLSLGFPFPFLSFPSNTEFHC